MKSNRLEAQAAAWLLRREAANGSEEERAQFEEWLGADARHRAVFARLEAAWHRADAFRRLRPRDGTVNPNLLTDTLLPALTGADRIDPDDFGEESGLRRHQFVLVAAAVLALVAIGLSAWWSVQRLEWQRYATDFGGFQRVVLPDGSAVNLNTNSEIQVHFTAAERSVHLVRGEALFTVERDMHRPFEVAAGDTRVRALGTVFSVRMQASKQVEVMVTEGRVVIDPPTGRVQQPEDTPASKASTLSAGETVTIAAHRLHVAKVAVEEVSRKLGWMDGRLWFDQQTLGEAITEFNRYNRRQIAIVDPAIAGLHVGGGFESTDPDSFVAALEHVFGVRAFPAGSGDDETIRLAGTDDR